MNLISWPEHLYRVITHNPIYALAVLHQWLYIKFDQWRESVYVRMGRGQSKDYHLMMVGHTAKDIAQTYMSKPYMAFFAAHHIIKMLKLSERREQFAMAAFHPSFRLAFIYERDIMSMVKIQESIVDGKTLLQAFEHFTIAGQRQLEFVLGKELYAQFEASDLESVRKHFLDIEMAKMKELNKIVPE